MQSVICLTAVGFPAAVFYCCFHGFDGSAVEYYLRGYSLTLHKAKRLTLSF